MEISSSSFPNGGMIPARYTCDGKNVNPPLEFNNVPKEASSLVLIMDDPDAPGKTWVHWTVWNMPRTSKKISETEIPDGSTEGMTDFGRRGYGGPCPSEGTHHYYFRLFALDISLDLDEDSDRAALDEAMKDHVVDQAELIGIYFRG